MPQLEYLDANNPIHRVNPQILSKLVSAQWDLLDKEYKTGISVINRVCADLGLKALKMPSKYASLSAQKFANQNFSSLNSVFREILEFNGIASTAIVTQAFQMAFRSQLLLAFHDPDTAVNAVKTKIVSVINDFPRSMADLECGRNKGDVLDPYILAAAQILLFCGEFSLAINSVISHKAIMIIEGLMGHLHEDVIGMMRGNVRVPEPRGEDQEKIDYISNPFPGADMLQPPTKPGQRLRFHQIKSKTGSAKGGDGKRLGQQLAFLQDHYHGDIYYHALIGNTLRGHRSKTGVEKAAPNVIVLVGDASFKELTRTVVGPELLLRLYQASFMEASKESGYNLDTISKSIIKAFVDRAGKEGESFLENILYHATSGPVEEQDNRVFNKIGHRARAK